MMKCHVLPHASEEGPANMALDEALLEQATAEPETAYVRTYGWRVPTLSLGYFQRIADARMDARWIDVPLTRRPTGGGAIWHQRELTYAVILPSSHPATRRSIELYRTVHGAILQVLWEQGVEAHRRGEPRIPSVPGATTRPSAFLCFLDHDREDIVSAGFKVVGSAQRKRRGAILQHGSILLESTDLTPELQGIRDLAEVSRDPLRWAPLVQRALVESLDLEAFLDEIPAVVVDSARELEARIYRESSWTDRR